MNTRPSFLHAAAEIVSPPRPLPVYRELVLAEENDDGLTVAKEAYGGLTITWDGDPNRKPVQVQIDSLETARMIAAALLDWAA